MNFRTTKINRIISAVLFVACTIMIRSCPIDIRYTTVPKLVIDYEVETTNDRKKVKC